jgi:hypothetical protein
MVFLVSSVVLHWIWIVIIIKCEAIYTELIVLSLEQGCVSTNKSIFSVIDKINPIPDIGNEANEPWIINKMLLAVQKATSC